MSIVRCGRIIVPHGVKEEVADLTEDDVVGHARDGGDRRALVIPERVRDEERAEHARADERTHAPQAAVLHRAAQHLADEPLRSSEYVGHS